MRVERLGEGEPEVAVVGGVHGDEICGVRAIERLAADAPSVARPVKLVIANERALERGVRYVDVDLNREFPGDPDSDLHERRLAHRLAAEVEGCTVLSMHSTQSYAGTFAVVGRLDEFARSVCSRIAVDAVVDTGAFVQGRLFAAAAETLEVECGLQGSRDAVENASRLTREFLTAVGVLPGETPVGSVPAFRLTDVVEKPTGDTYEVFVDNFERVAADDTVAAVDGNPVTADRTFYPVLLSAGGYADVFGYAAEYVGRLDHEALGDAG